MASTTRFSPSSYPTLSFHVGNDTEMAWAVKGGTDMPSVSCCVFGMVIVTAVLIVSAWTRGGVLRFRSSRSRGDRRREVEMEAGVRDEGEMYRVIRVNGGRRLAVTNVSRGYLIFETSLSSSNLILTAWAPARLAPETRWPFPASSSDSDSALFAARTLSFIPSTKLLLNWFDSRNMEDGAPLKSASMEALDWQMYRTLSLQPHGFGNERVRIW